MSESEPIGEVLAEMMSPLLNTVEIVERCPDCHVPLHRGRELHWERIERRRPQGMSRYLRRTLREHQCTGLAVPATIAVARLRPLDKD